MKEDEPSDEEKYDEEEKKSSPEKEKLDPSKRGKSFSFQKTAQAFDYQTPMNEGPKKQTGRRKSIALDATPGSSGKLGDFTMPRNHEESTADNLVNKTNIKDDR